MVVDDKFTHEETHLAVDGQRICVYFDRRKTIPALKKVDITVESGTIYVLLGPSGCGKTTLVKCIVGQQKLHEGFLKVYGKKPGSRGFFIPGPGVGYMPQDLALYPEMTIEETLSYFGSLFHMDRRQLNARISFLVDFLRLPDKTKQIKCLSGGQQRCTSFAASLIHKPPLLILDEPTVGADPVLSKNMWSHLVGLAKEERMTIIITTHSVEEARQAHTVGLMRNGRLLIERNPNVLMQQHGVYSFKEVFLRIYENNCNKDGIQESGGLTSVQSLSTNGSVKNNETKWISTQVHSQYPCEVEAECAFQEHENDGEDLLICSNGNHAAETVFLSPFSFAEEFYFAPSAIRSFTQSLKRLLCLTKKNFLLLRKNVFNTVFQIVFPAFIGLLFYVSFGKEPYHIPVAIVDVDHHGLGNAIMKFVNKQSLDQKHFPNLSLAIESVRNGQNWAALHMGPDFSACLLERFMEGLDVSNDTITCGYLSLYMDMTNKIIFSTIAANIFKGLQNFVRDLLKRADKTPLAAELPLQINEAVYGSEDSTFTEFMAPGMILGLTYVMATILAEMCILLEKKRGLLDRTFVAGGTPGEVFLSLFFSLLFTLTIQITLMLIVAFVVFQNTCEGSMLWVIVCMFIVGINGISFGFLISAICDDENVAVFVSVGTYFCYYLVSGVIWPLEGMPYYLRHVSRVLPLTKISYSFRSILYRGWGILDHDVWVGYAIVTTWCMTFIVLTIVVFKIRK